MSGYNDYSDLFDPDEGGHQDGKGLRAQLEQALSEIRSLRSELTQEKRAKTLADLFAEKGKDPAAAALVPEGVDPKDWLDKNAAFIADAKKEEQVVEESKEEKPEGDGGAAPEVPDPRLLEEQAAFETITGLVGTGIPSTATADPIEKMKSFQTEEELLNFIRSNGAG